MFRFYLSVLILLILLFGQQTNLAQNPSPDIKPQATPASKETRRWSGSYQATFNVSVLGKLKPSSGHKFGLSDAPKFGGPFDSRFEYYVDGRITPTRRIN